MKVIVECDYRPGLDAFEVKIEVPDVLEIQENIAVADFRAFMQAFSEHPALTALGAENIKKIMSIFEREMETYEAVKNA
jgi:hypothetical protein